MSRFIKALTFLLIAGAAIAQDLESELLFYGDVMIYAFEDENRLRAMNEFSELFKSYLDKDPSLEGEADFKKYLSILDLDKNRKLVSWRVKTIDYKYDFGCYLLEKGKEPIPFVRTDALSTDMAFMTSTSNDWYGCYYYNFKKLSKNQWLILGYDPSSEFDNQKVADILTIDQSGKITLGAPLFEDKEARGTFINRVILSYSSDAAVNLNFDTELGILINDHLEPRLGMQAGQGATNIPDGTYEGYKEKGGKWMYEEKIFNHIYETAPIPKPTQSGLFREK